MIGDRHEPKHDAPLLKRINNHFWSIDIGPAHFLMFSSEFYYYTEYGWEQIEWQYRFIEEDLKRANKNRAQRPWIIAMAHKPFYISDGAHQDKGLELERGELRKGVHMYGDAKRPLQFGLEKLFYDQGVDLEFFGHEHLFARYLPIHNYVFHDSKNGSNPYANSLAPIPIITGSAGCRELPTQFSKHIQPYVVKRNYNYGYTRLHFASDKQIVMEQLSDDLVRVRVLHLARPNLTNTMLHSLVEWQNYRQDRDRKGRADTSLASTAASPLRQLEYNSANFG